MKICILHHPNDCTINLIPAFNSAELQRTRNRSKNHKLVGQDRLINFLQSDGHRYPELKRIPMTSMALNLLNNYYSLILFHTRYNINKSTFFCLLYFWGGARTLSAIQVTSSYRLLQLFRQKLSYMYVWLMSINVNYYPQA